MQDMMLIKFTIHQTLLHNVNLFYPIRVSKTLDFELLLNLFFEASCRYCICLPSPVVLAMSQFCLLLFPTIKILTILLVVLIHVHTLSSILCCHLRPTHLTLDH